MSQKVCHHMLSLKDSCLHPTSKKPYIKSSIGGEDNSPEGIQVSSIFWIAGELGDGQAKLCLLTSLAHSQLGFTHAFVVEFESEEDRNYYVKSDEAHRAFVGSIGDSVDRVQVIDFTPGKYGWGWCYPVAYSVRG